MSFLKEVEPARGIAEPIVDGVRRVVARNAGLMTYHGTNTYIVDHDAEVLVIDPGPDDLPHVEAILAVIGGRPSRILLTHTHGDHLGAAAQLKAATGAAIYSYRESAKPGFRPDIPLAGGDVVAGLIVVHTPGHAADHICFARADGVLFSGDHVMAWSSTVVRPPKGDMAAYYASLQLLLTRDDALYLPGHGPVLSDPRSYVRDLLKRRQAREEAIAAIIARSALTPVELTDMLYSKTHAILRAAAECNVTAHLLKLEAEGRAERVGDRWRA